MKRLIVSADDLGLHPGINAGVFTACRQGIVTSVSIVANGAAFEPAVRELKRHPEIDLGVHLTLVGERPLLPPETLPTLAPDGRLVQHFPGFFRRLLLRQVREAEIERELTAQLARVHDAGLCMTHLDSHQHVHMHPAVLPIVLRLARRFDVRGIRAAGHLRPLRGLRPALLVLFARSARRRARRVNLRTPDWLLGLTRSGHMDEEYLIRLIRHLPRGTSELICHPGVDDGALSASYRWGYHWNDETAALTSARVRAAVGHAGVSLVGYNAL